MTLVKMADLPIGAKALREFCDCVMERTEYGVRWGAKCARHGDVGAIRVGTEIRIHPLQVCRWDPLVEALRQAFQ